MPLTLTLQSFARLDSRLLIDRVSSGTGPSAGESALSGDGRYVVFQSYSNDLVSGDTNNARDIFRRDLVTGAIERVSTKADGTEINLNSEHASVSHDGRYILFESASDALVTGDTNGKSDVFRKDMVTGEVLRVSTGGAGAQLGDFSLGSQISADGQFAVFATQDGSLVAGDTNGTFDIFLKNIATDAVTCVSKLGAIIGNGASSNAVQRRRRVRDLRQRGEQSRGFRDQQRLGRVPLQCGKRHEQPPIGLDQ